MKLKWTNLIIIKLLLLNYYYLILLLEIFKPYSQKINKIWKIEWKEKKKKIKKKSINRMILNQTFCSSVFLKK